MPTATYDKLVVDVLVLQARLVALLKQLAEAERPCQACQRPLYFIRHPRTKKLMPYTDEGISHFADCPAAAKFQKPKPSA